MIKHYKWRAVDKHVLCFEAWVVKLFNATELVELLESEILIFLTKLSCGRNIRAVELLEQVRYMLLLLPIKLLI